jgi:hypothetical protein
MYGKLDVPLFLPSASGFDCPEGTVLGLNCCLYGAKQAPACFKAVLTEYWSAGFTACNDSDSQTVWIKQHNQSVLYCATFVDDVQHCTMTLPCTARFANSLKKMRSQIRGPH